MSDKELKKYEVEVQKWNFSNEVQKWNFSNLRYQITDQLKIQLLFAILIL